MPFQGHNGDVPPSFLKIMKLLISSNSIPDIESGIFKQDEASGTKRCKMDSNLSEKLEMQLHSLFYFDHILL